MEERYPDKCSRCGAPIQWKEGATFTECGFCGKRNFVKRNLLYFLGSFNLKDPKLIIRNPVSLILFLPLIFLFIVINLNLNKESNLVEQYWPTDWNKLKQTKSERGTFPEDFNESEKESHTVKFKSDIIEACKYRNKLKKELKNFEFNRDKSLYEKNIQVGNKAQFGIYEIQMVNPLNVNQDPSYLKSPYVHPIPTQYQADKKATIRNFERINRNLIKEGKNYWNYYVNVYDNIWKKEVYELLTIIDQHNNKIYASFVEVQRQLGDKNWKLYSRWGLMGIRDLYTYYNQEFRKSASFKKITFGDWLLKKGILDETHMRKHSSGKNFLKYFITIVEESKVDRICEIKK